MRAPNSEGNRVIPVLTGTLAAILAGVLAAVFGTVLQGHVAYAGETPLPWGAVLALVMAGSLAAIAGLYTERIWAAALAGIVTYALVAWTSVDTHNRLLIGWSNFGALPGPALAGTVWTYGIAASTIVALLVTAGGLRTRAARR